MSQKSQVAYQRSRIGSGKRKKRNSYTIHDIPLEIIHDHVLAFFGVNDQYNAMLLIGFNDVLVQIIAY
jgi:hypothetical protein